MRTLRLFVYLLSARVEWKMARFGNCRYMPPTFSSIIFESKWSFSGSSRFPLHLDVQAGTVRRLFCFLILRHHPRFMSMLSPARYCPDRSSCYTESRGIKFAKTRRHQQNFNISKVVSRLSLGVFAWKSLLISPRGWEVKSHSKEKKSIANGNGGFGFHTR